MNHDTPEHGAGPAEYDWTAAPPEEDAPPPDEDGDQAARSNAALTTSGAPDQAGPAGGDLPDVRPIKRPDGLPVLGDDALYGIVGEIVRSNDPYTEADPAAVLVTLLTGAGAVIGDGPHVERDGRHGCRLFVLVGGDTAEARKGSSDSSAMRYLRESIDLACQAGMPDPFDTSRITGGLSSGEGVIDLVADVVWRKGTEEEPAGWILKEGAESRLLLMESEFASVLSKGSRQGNDLTQTLRKFWDGTPVATLTTGNPRRAEGAHVCMVAHATAGELLAKLSKGEIDGGTMNRLLYACSYQSKEIAFAPNDGRNPDFYRLSRRLAEALIFGQKTGEMDFTSEARDYWKRRRYVLGDMIRAAAGTPVGRFITRAAPYNLRLAVLYAVLDSSAVIDVPHLKAAEALWHYCEASARTMFDNAEERAEKREDLKEDIFAAIAAEEIRLPDQAGVPADVIRRKVRHGKTTAGDRRAALEALEAEGRIMSRKLTRSDGKAGRARYEYRTAQRG